MLRRRIKSLAFHCTLARSFENLAVSFGARLRNLGLVGAVGELELDASSAGMMFCEGLVINFIGDAVFKSDVVATTSTGSRI